MFHFSTRSLPVGAICAALLAGVSAAHAQVLDPNAFASSGALSLASGTYTLDTDALTFAGNSGVLSNGIAVFDFSSINVAPNATVNVVGSHPLALLSQSDATFGAGSSFNLNGGNGSGGQINSMNSSPPPGGAGGIAGSGGYGGAPGSGYGGNGGGGGGFGGGGGHYGSPTPGPTYGDLLNKLEGGGGGGGGGGISGGRMAESGAGGGGGGGAIEINAIGALTLAGNLNTIGGGGGFGVYGYGGGGAGGGVLLAGNKVTLASTGGINAYGGAGAGSFYVPNSGGGGGGGRITIQTAAPDRFVSSGLLNVKGGSGNLAYSFDSNLMRGPDYYSNGGNGVITINGRVTSTPAPGSLLVAALGVVPVVVGLRRRRK